MKQVCWSKIILETFLEESGINDRIKLDHKDVEKLYRYIIED